MALLKFTNVASSFQGGVPIVLNGENLISIYADNTDSACWVINLNSEADYTEGLVRNVGQIILTEGTGYDDFAKEVNEAITSAPSASVIPVNTTAEISTFSYFS